MEKKLILTSKILLALFFVILAVFVVYSWINPSDDIVLPSAIVIAAILIVLLNAIVFIVLCILETVARYGERKIHAFTELLLHLVFIFAALLIFDVFVLKNKFSPVDYAATSFGITVISQGMNYWRRS